MKVPQDIIENMIRTEKGTNLLTQNKHLFNVAKAANKIEIRQAVEAIYKVKVTAVNIINVKGKKRRVRFREGMTASWKKAIVTLAAGSKIEVT